MKSSSYSVTIIHELSRIMEYRGNFFFRLGVNSVIPLITKLFLFDAFFRATARTEIAGWTRDDMIHYQFWGALAILVIEIRTTVENVQLDIRMGRITRYLLYPISMFEIVTCQYLASLLLQLLVFVIGIWVMSYGLDGFPVHIDSGTFWLSLFYILMGSIFWYVIHFTIGLISFWLEEIWTFFIIFQMTGRFLGGNPIPIDMFWPWWQSISEYLPFHWMFYAPVKMFVRGEYVDNAFMGLWILPGWICLTCLLHTFVWKQGLKQYSASGM